MSGSFDVPVARYFISSATLRPSGFRVCHRYSQAGLELKGVGTVWSTVGRGRGGSSASKPLSSAVRSVAQWVDWILQNIQLPYLAPENLSRCGSTAGGRIQLGVQECSRTTGKVSER